jgi:hypothetical protein
MFTCLIKYKKLHLLEKGKRSSSDKQTDKFTNKQIYKQKYFDKFTNKPISSLRFLLFSKFLQTEYHVFRCVNTSLCKMSRYYPQNILILLSKPFNIRVEFPITSCVPFFATKAQQHCSIFNFVDIVIPESVWVCVNIISSDKRDQFTAKIDIYDRDDSNYKQTWSKIYLLFTIYVEIPILLLSSHPIFAPTEQSCECVVDWNQVWSTP